MAQKDLDQVPGWSAHHVAQLGKSWISSAEQVVAVSVTSGGVQSLAQQLGVTDEEARRLIDLARDALPPEVRQEMGRRFDSDDRGMGVMPPGREDGDKPDGKG